MTRGGESRPALADALATIADRWPSAVASDEAPVFVLAAGWRSGSTLTQRLVASRGRVLLWGEPFDHCCLVQRLAESLLPFASQWPPDPWIVPDPCLGDLGTHWTANLYPGVDDLVAGHRALFERVFAAPARAAGAPRWGLKETRLDGEHARYLRWLYPRARIVLLVRNPWDAFRSYAHIARSPWFDRWPGSPVRTVTQFARLWRRLAASFLEHGEAAGALLLRYEDVCAGGAALRALGEHVEETLDASVLRRRVGAARKPPPLTRARVAAIARIAGDTARALSYREPPPPPRRTGKMPR